MGTTVLRLIDGTVFVENRIFNPSAERSTLGCLANDSTTVTITRSATKAKYGLYSFFIEPAGSLASEGVSFYEDNVKTKFKVHEGLPYIFFADVIADAVADEKPLDFEILWYDKSGTLISTSTVLTVITLSSTVWKKLFVTDIAPTNARYAVPRTKINTSTANRADYYIDGANFQQTPHLDMSHVDGDQPGCQWLGIYHASRSIKGEVREVVDFIDGGIFKVKDGGLDIPAPEAIRLMGGDPLLSDRGQRLIERKYNNRQINIDFKVEGVTGTALRTELNRLQRILDDAVSAAKYPQSNRVVLEWAAESMPEPILFDIIDGDITYQFDDPLFARTQSMLYNSIALTARPVGRSKFTIPLNNHIINSDFDAEHTISGLDGANYRTFGTVGDRLERADCIGLRPRNSVHMTAFAWIYRTTSGGVRTICKAGNVETDATTLNRGAWKIELDATDKAVFRFWQADNTEFNMTADITVPINTWTFIAITVDRRGTEVFWAMYQNGEVVAYETGALVPSTVRATTGKFTVGALNDDTERFTGRIQNLGVLLVPFTGVEILHLFLAGTKSLTEHESSWFTNKYFWNLQPSNLNDTNTLGAFGASWPNFSGSPVVDAGPAARNLTVVGAPAVTETIQNPNGWTIGSSLSSAAGAGLRERSELTFNPRTGRYGYVFKDAAGDANTFIRQRIVIPLHKRSSGHNRWWTAVIWVRANVDTQAVALNIATSVGTDSFTATSTFNLADNWSIWLYTFEITDGSTYFDFTIQKTSGVVDFVVDYAGCLEGTPFGMRRSSAAQRPGKAFPIISSRFLQRTEFNSLGKVPNLLVRDIPGDQLAGCKLFLENTDLSFTVSPIRIGLLYGADIGRVLNTLYAAGFNAIGSASDILRFISGNYNVFGIEIATPTINSWLSFGSHPLASLIPEIQKVYGTFKLLAAIAKQTDTGAPIMYAASKLSGQFGGDLPIIQTPVKIPNVVVTTQVVTTEIGLLNWPPIISAEMIAKRQYQGRMRSIEIASINANPIPENVSRLVIEGLITASNDFWFLYLDIIPAEHGYFALASPSVVTGGGVLVPDTTLVINSIDEEGRPAYMTKQPAVNSYFTEGADLEAASDMLSTGEPFKLTPQDNNLFTIMYEQRRPETNPNPVTGNRPTTGDANDDIIEAYIEYEARYLYV